jgi:putative membrane protein
MINWILRFFKGFLIGMDFIIPGVSGAALAVVFGLYERIIEFIAHLTKNFFKNILFFLPVLCGALVGIYLVSYPMSFLLKNYPTPVLWFFVGTILGTMPDLWKKSGEKGRKPRHIIILISTFILSTFYLLFSGFLGSLNTFPAVIIFGIGAMVALFVFIPGFSSSTFMVILGFLPILTDAFHNLNFPILIPFFLGILVFLFPFSRGIEFLIKRVFTGFFHVIFGFVLASVVLIAALASGWPQEMHDYLQISSLACVGTLVAGTIFAYFMCIFSKKYE